jgi:predicted Zn finger-like uncharacterized protein
MNRMRIACPSCGAEYEVPDRLLAGPARTLRCSRCGADFALPQAPPAAAPPPAPLPEPPPPAPVAPEPPAAVAPAPVAPPATPEAPAPAVRERAPVAQAPTDQAALVRAWAASLLVVVGGVLALLVFRTQVMSAWPPATRLFAVLGLA